MRVVSVPYAWRENLWQGLVVIAMLLRPRAWLPSAAIDAYDAHRFEVASALGRLRQRPYTEQSLDYLQVGSYATRLPGFLNTDQFGCRGVDYHVDIRHPLPFSDNRWKGIFAHHTVEHINYSDCLTFFREACRCLRPNGLLRIAVPDVEKFIAAYVNKRDALPALIPNGHDETVECKTPLGYVNWAFFSHPKNAHKSAWDFETMQHALKLSGFGEVERAEVGVSADKNMVDLDTPEWADHTLYVEARKPNGF